MATPTQPISTTGRPGTKSVVSAGLEAFQLVVETGLLRCAVPRALGGNGGSLDDLARGASAIATHGRAAAWILWAQRTAIEALVHSPNVAVREYLLPAMLDGELAGTLPLALETKPVLAEEVANGFKLYGLLEHVPNLQWSGFSLIAPIRRLGQPIEWVVLRSEESGLRVGIDLEGDFWHGSRTASVTLDGAFFRIDEWLNGPSMVRAILPVMEALGGPALPGIGGTQAMAHG